MNLENLIQIIEEGVFKEITDILNDNKPLPNYLFSFFLKESSASDIEKIMNYSSSDSDSGYFVLKRELHPPYYITHDVLEDFRIKFQIDSPLATIYLEKKELSHKDKSKSYWDQLKGGDIKESEESGFYVQYETYRGIKKYEYKVLDDNTIERLEDEVPVEKRLFLPIFN